MPHAGGQRPLGAGDRRASRRGSRSLRAGRERRDRRSGLSTASAGLERFRTAQAGGAHELALSELRAGEKRGHWIWFVLPQLRGLGRSPTAQRYGIASLEEARAYLRDPVLGPRLRECCEALLALAPTRSVDEVLGSLDALKLRSCMTLFHRADPEDPRFTAVLERFFAGASDEITDQLLAPEIG